MKKKGEGFTLIELVIFIIITGLLGMTILLALSTAASKTPTVQPLTIALQTAKQCMEWFVGQRRLMGYNALPCPSSATPSFCTTPTGFTLTVNIACTTFNTDTQYKTIMVNVTGPGSASLSTLIANY